MAPFRRSSRFGVIGVVVVMVLVAAIALNVDERDAEPKEALGLIFLVIGAYMVLLFLFQTRDLSRAEAAAAELLTGVPNSPRWNGLKGAAGAAGIAIEHRGTGHGDWLMDLWLAERLADALK